MVMGDETKNLYGMSKIHVTNIFLSHKHLLNLYPTKLFQSHIIKINNDSFKNQHKYPLTFTQHV